MPHLIVNLDLIKNNFTKVKSLCDKRNIDLALISKCVLSIPLIINGLYEYGLKLVGDTRLKNLVNLDCPVDKMLLIVSKSILSEGIEACNYLYVSDLSLLEAIAGLKGSERFNIIIPVELGELREGVPLSMVESFMDAALKIKGITIAGLSSNFGCLSGIVPAEDGLYNFVEVAHRIKKNTGFEFPLLSLGGTILYTMLENNEIPAEINQLRFGEAVYNGFNTSLKQEITSLTRHAFVLEGELIEIYDKNTDISGVFGFNAFGDMMNARNKTMQKIVNQGIRKRAVLDFGFLCSTAHNLIPLDNGIIPIANSHDHTVIDITDAEKVWCVGDRVKFYINYDIAYYSFLSPYISKVFID